MEIASGDIRSRGWKVIMERLRKTKKGGICQPRRKGRARKRR